MKIHCEHNRDENFGRLLRDVGGAAEWRVANFKDLQELSEYWECQKPKVPFHPFRKRNGVLVWRVVTRQDLRAVYWVDVDSDPTAYLVQEMFIRQKGFKV